MRYAFEECVVDTDAFELHRSGEPVDVEPRVFDVLAHLLRHRDRLVTRDELLDEVCGVYLFEASLLHDVARFGDADAARRRSAWLAARAGGIATPPLAARSRPA